MIAEPCKSQGFFNDKHDVFCYIWKTIKINNYEIIGR